MHILRRLPFRDRASSVGAGEIIIPILAYQIVVWVSLSRTEVLEKDAKRFPTVLDTGHSHNFSIRESQLLDWAGIQPALLPELGGILVNREEVPLRGASLWIHRNRPGTVDLLTHPFSLTIPEGIAIYPAGRIGGPRLPLLGLRGLVQSKLHLLIDGTGLTVSLRT